MRYKVNVYISGRVNIEVEAESPEDVKNQVIERITDPGERLDSLVFEDIDIEDAEDAEGNWIVY